MSNKGMIFDIQGFSVHDGPGTRTTVFLKGCPLKCQWCANPESWSTEKEILWTGFKCISCGKCVSACPENALSLKENRLSIDSPKCSSCDSIDCVDACFKGALNFVGEEYSSEDLMDLLSSHRDSWGPDGGVTFSGGEPLLQKNFLLDVLKKCDRDYIHTAIETTAFCDTDDFLEIMNYVHFAFIDLKHMDMFKHREKTGVKNDLVLKNISALSSSTWDGELVLRVPVIELFNDDDDNIKSMIRFMKENELQTVNLLPFHRMGESKWKGLDRTYSYSLFNPTSPEKMNHLKSLFTSEGIDCFLGSDTPF